MSLVFTGFALGVLLCPVMAGAGLAARLATSAAFVDSGFVLAKLAEFWLSLIAGLGTANDDGWETGDREVLLGLFAELSGVEGLTAAVRLGLAPELAFCSVLAALALEDAIAGCAAALVTELSVRAARMLDVAFPFVFGVPEALASDADAALLASATESAFAFDAAAAELGAICAVDFSGASAPDPPPHAASWAVIARAIM